MMFPTVQIAVLLIAGFVESCRAYVYSSNHRSESGHSSSSSHNSGHAYSYNSHSAQGPGYSYSYSHSDGGVSPLFLPGYATGYHSYTPLFISPIDFDIDFDLDSDIDPELDFLIDTDLDLDLDLDFPGIEYGLGYIGKYGHWLRKPKYGFSRLYGGSDLNLWNYGGNYGYDSIDPSLSFF
ncbi:Hypothetical protein CINCED_3A018676 [Cinara cedri]|nr:Hypothetical protein CINCED_3A018676 [Cinara cedri]